MNKRIRVKIETDKGYKYGIVDGYVMSPYNTVFAIVIYEDGSFGKILLSSLKAVGELETKINTI